MSVTGAVTEEEAVGRNLKEEGEDGGVEEATERNRSSLQASLGEDGGGEERRKKEENENKEKKEDGDGDGGGDREADLELFSCMLQPLSSDSDPDYVGIRRLLLYRKAAAGVDRRKDWRCNGKGYVSFRNYISRPLNWESLYSRSFTSTPNQSERWISSPAQLALLLEVDSLCSSRDLRGSNSNQARASFSSSASDSERFGRYRKKVEPAYSFVGMHCIFDQCKVSVTVVKFGHMSSDLLAYGASDGSITVCTVSETPKVLNLLTGHSRDVTGWMN